jgi:hypothetical protein
LVFRGERAGRFSLVGLFAGSDGVYSHCHLHRELPVQFLCHILLELVKVLCRHAHIKKQWTSSGEEQLFSLVEEKKCGA